MSEGWPGASVEMEAELPLPARAERWALLVLQLSSLALCRRFMMARECAAALRQHKVLRVTNRQWQCLHPLVLRRISYNQHGPLVLCGACNLRLKYSCPLRSGFRPMTKASLSRSSRDAEELSLRTAALHVTDAEAATRFGPTTTAEG